MKNAIMKINLLFLVLLMMPHALYGLVDGMMTTSSVVLATEADDEYGNQIILVGVGTPNTAPTTWVVTNISDPVGYGQNTTPKVFANSNGDVVVLWTYINSDSGFAQVAAASMLSGSGVWNSTDLSQGTGDAAQYDFTAFIDDATNVIVVWSVYDFATNTYAPYITMTNLTTDTSWTMPVEIID